MAEIQKQHIEPAANKDIEPLGNRSPLTLGVSALRRALGTPRYTDEAQSEYDIQFKLDQYRDQLVFPDFYDLFSRNALPWRLKSVQLQADMRTVPTRLELDRRRELIIANQAVTYNEYLPAVLEQVTDFMTCYDAEMEEILPSLPPERRQELTTERNQAVRYIEAMRMALQDRVNFSNVNALDRVLAELPQNPLQEEKRKKMEIARKELQSRLTPASQEVLSQEEQLRSEYLAENDKGRQQQLLETIFQKRYEHILQSENDLIERLKGNPQEKNLPGAPKDFLPQRLYLRLLQERYGQLRALQTDIARAKDWTEEERRGAQNLLRIERRQMMSQMVGVTQLLAVHHQQLEESTFIQGQFGQEYLLEGANKPFAAATNEQVRERIDRSIEGAQEFHLERLQAMLKEVDHAFAPNGLESLNDAGILELVERVDGISGVLRHLITAALPEGESKKSIDTWLDTNLPLAITDSLESDLGPDGRPMSKAQKLQHIRDIIIAFRDKRSIARYSQTLALLQRIPKAKNFVMEDVQQDAIIASAGKRFMENPAGSTIMIDGKATEINGATAIVLLLGQMKTDAESFAGDYGEFLREMEDMVDIRLSLIVEVNRIAESWKTAAQMMGLSAGQTYVISILLGGAAGTLATKALLKAPTALRSILKSPRELTKAFSANRLMLTGASAVQAYRLYKDFEQIGETQKAVDVEHARLIAEITSTGFVPDPAEKDRFIYKDGGTEVTVELSSLHSAREWKVVSDMVQTGGDATQLFLLLRALRAGSAPLRATPPQLVIEATVETVRYGIDQKSDRTFLARCPAWLLAKIDVEGTIGDSPYGILATASERMLTDPLTKDAANEKEGIRQKMLFVLLQQELGEITDIHQSVFPLGGHPLELDAFFKDDFQKVILPYFALRLYQLSEGALTLQNAKHSRVGDDTDFPARTPDVSLLDVRRALREAAVVCAEHKHEKDYLEAQRALVSLQSNPDRDDLTLGILQTAVHELGKQKVLGESLESIPPSFLTNDDSRTRVERLVSILSRGVQHGDWVVPAKTLPGVANALDFSNGNAVLDRMQLDPALRMQIEAVYPRTLTERDNAAGREWHDVAFYTNLLHFRQPSAMGALSATDFHLSFASGAADNIRRELSRRPITASPTVSNALLGASSGEQATIEYALDRITKDSIDFVESEPEIVTQRSHLLENVQLARDLYSRSQDQPIVLTRGNPDVQICRTLSSASLPQEYRKSLPLQAVIFESKKFSSSTHQMVLATYIFGDVLKGEIFITQRASAQSTIVGLQGSRVTDGFPRACTAQELETKPGYSQMLNAVRANLRLHEKQRKIAQIENGKQRPERLRQEQKLLQQYRQNREEAIRQSQKSDNYILVPGKNPGDPAEYRRRFGDRTLSIPIPFTGSSVGEAKKLASGVAQPDESDAFVVHLMEGSGTTMHDLCLSNAADMDREDLSGDDRNAMRTALTTPILGKSQESLLRVIRLFPREMYIPGKIASLRYNARFSMPELFKDLIALYEKADDVKKSEFLETLFDQLRERRVINEKTNSEILKWFTENASRFEAKK